MTLVFSCQAWFRTQQVLEVLMVFGVIAVMVFSSGVKTKIVAFDDNEARHIKHTGYMFRALIGFAVLISILAMFKFTNVVHITGFDSSTYKHDLVNQICKDRDRD